MKIPTRDEKIQMLKKNIITAFEDYRSQTNCSYLDNIDNIDDFAANLAVASYEGKGSLRNVLRHSTTWDEELDATTINGNKTHEPNISRAHGLFVNIIDMLSRDQYEEINDGMNWLTFLRLITNQADDIEPEKTNKVVRFLNGLDEKNKIYVPGKKPSRILKALFSHYSLEGTEFERLFAQIADEVNSKKINFKYVVSVNPAHFLTMSNPHSDKRGTMLVSCHSLDSGYEYKNGCSGYAQDDVTLITFIPADPKDPETYNNRKTMRQLFFYKDGLLLQSRLYDSDGGTRGDMADTMRIYRELVQKEISDCENSVNLWDTKRYVYSDYPIEAGEEFGGYPDWKYSGEWDLRISRKKGKTDFKKFTIGKRGLCLGCGSPTCSGDALFCEDCGDDYCCDECGQRFDEDDLYYVYDRDGSEIRVCYNCRCDSYYYCDNCDEFHHYDNCTEINGEWYCDECRDRCFFKCDICGDWEPRDEMTTTADGNEVCSCCLESDYTQCDECGEWIKNSDVVETADGSNICEDCMDKNFFECEECGEVFPNDEKVEKDGKVYCKDCAEEEEKEAV